MAKKKSASSPREKRISASEIFTKPLSKRQQADIARLAKMADSDIDYSDAPEVKRPSKVFVGRFYKPVKQLVSLRLDADVLAWFKSQGSGYQTYMNQVLRREMKSH